MVRKHVISLMVLSGALLLAGCGDNNGTGPDPDPDPDPQPRPRTVEEQLSDRPVAVKNSAIVPQFFDSQLAEPAAGGPMTAEAVEAFLANIQDPQVDVSRVRSRIADPAISTRVPQVGMRLALAYISEFLPEVWEQFTTATTPSGKPLAAVLHFSRGPGAEWESGAVYARVQPVPGTDQLDYVINDLYQAEDPRVLGPIIAHEVLTHTSAHNSMYAEAVGVGIQAHLYSQIVSNNPDLLAEQTRLRQIVNQLTIQYMMGRPGSDGASPSAQGIRSSNRNRPLVVTSDRLTQRSFLSLFGAMESDAIPGSAILGTAYQRLLGSSRACPTETIDAATTTCLDEEIGTWSMGQGVLNERVQLADLFTLDLQKMTD